MSTCCATIALICLYSCTHFYSCYADLYIIIALRNNQYDFPRKNTPHITYIGPTLCYLIEDFTRRASPVGESWTLSATFIGVNSTAFGRKLTLFCSAIPLSRFPLKMSRFFAYFELGKMRSMRSAQRQVELRLVGNQLPVFGKANSLCKMVKCCVFCPCGFACLLGP